MMKQPTEDDFTVVQVLESGVTVLFEPTQSFYTFYRLADPDDIKRFGLVSPEPDVARHAGPPGAPVTLDQMKRKGDDAFVSLRCSEGEVAGAPDAL